MNNTIHHILNHIPNIQHHKLLQPVSKQVGRCLFCGILSLRIADSFISGPKGRCVIRVVRASYYVISLVGYQNILTVFILSACQVFQCVYSKPRCATGASLKCRVYLDVIFKCVCSSGRQKRWMSGACEWII